MGVLSAVEHIFNETAMHGKAQASNRMAKGKQSKSLFMSEGKCKSKENKGESKRQSKGTKKCERAKGMHKGKTSKTGLSGLQNPKSEARSDTRESAQTCAH